MSKRNPLNQKENISRTNLRKIIFLVFAILAGIILILAVFVAISVFQEQKKNERASFVQKQKYAAVETACQTKPVVVIDSYSSFYGGSHSYIAYLPTSTKYESMKTSVIQTTVFIGYDGVDGYYCSLETAQKVYKDKNLSIDPAQ